MRTALWGVPLALLLLFSIGCGTNGKTPWTPEKRLSAAKNAGLAAASGYLVIAKPDKPTALVVKIVVDKIRENLTAYREGGFVGALPGIDEAILKVLPKDEDQAKRVAAHNLGKILLEELDKLFEDHPDWKTLGDEAAGIIGAFLDSASSAFEPYLETKAPIPSTPATAEKAKEPTAPATAAKNE